MSTSGYLIIVQSRNKMQLEKQLWHCKDEIDQIRNVVLDLCKYMGISPEGLGPNPIRPAAAVLPAIGDLSTNIFHPHYADWGVGPDENPLILTSLAVDPGEADGIFELDVALAAPSSPTSLPNDKAPSPFHSQLPPIHLPPPTEPAFTNLDLSITPPRAEPWTSPGPPPHVNFIPATPHTLGEGPAMGVGHQATPPLPLPSLFGPPHPPIDLEDIAGSQGQHCRETLPCTPTEGPPVAVSLHRPPPSLPGAISPPLHSPDLRSRDMLPLSPPSKTLAPPPPCGMMTCSCSCTHSPSPAPIVAGSKREGDCSNDRTA